MAQELEGEVSALVCDNGSGMVKVREPAHAPHRPLGSGVPSFFSKFQKYLENNTQPKEGGGARKEGGRARTPRRLARTPR